MFMRYLINFWLKSTEYMSESSKNNFSAKKMKFFIKDFLSKCD